MSEKASKISWTTAGALVVANMIGTGVFTSLGFQVVDIKNTWSLLLLWFLGGIISLAGAFSYAEVGSVFTRSGGEYNYLSKLYNPIIGYLAGWVSLTVGFSAPVALTAMALGGYMGSITGLSETMIAVVSVIAIGIVHSFNIKSSSLFQNITTIFKVIVLAGIIIMGLSISSDTTGLDFSSGWKREIGLPAYAIALVYVTYAYTGWNAAAYIVEEIKAPKVNLPKALIRGTALVTLLYVTIHYVFLKHTTIDQLANKIDIGHVFALNVLGESGGMVISSLIGFFLISSISAMIWVGPRVSKVMGEDYSIWSFLKNTNEKGIPLNAIWFQISLSIIMIYTGTFEQILVYCGFLLQISSALCVFGSFIIRRSENITLGYKSRFHPFLPILFLGISLWILVFLISEKPMESLIGMSTLLIGLATYFISKKYFK